MNADELLALARDRPQVTRELHAPSAFYGHADALKRYAGMAAAARPKVAIEHGVAFTRYVWDVDAKAPVPTFLCAAPRRAERYAEVASPDRAAIPIGPMILYAESDSPPASDRRTLVAFTAHSTHHMDAVYDVDRFARGLERHRDDWDEIRVCLYWKDVLRGVHRVYQRRGFDCVSAGHIYDAAFLGRLRAIIEGAAAVISNEVGSFLFYAVAFGHPVWIVDGDVDYLAKSAAILRRDRSDPAEWDERTTAIRGAFAEPRGEVTDAQHALVDELAGLSSHRSPAELATVLADAEERYRAWAPPLRRARHRAQADGGRTLALLRSLRRAR